MSAPTPPYLPQENGAAAAHGQPAGVPTGNGFTVPVSNSEWQQLLQNPVAFDRWCGLVENISSLRKDLLSKMFDSRRNIDRECGYPDSEVGGFGIISPEFYRALYEREAIAWRAVRLMPLQSWQVSPLVFEDEDPETVTPFEQAWDKLGASLRGEQCWYAQEEGSPVWDVLKRVDILSGIGHFGVLLLGFGDGKNLDQPVDGVVSYDPTGNVEAQQRIDWRDLLVSNESGKPIGVRRVYQGRRVAVYPTSPRARPDPTCNELEIDTYPSYTANGEVGPLYGLPKLAGRKKYESMPTLTTNGISPASLPKFYNATTLPASEWIGEMPPAPTANELPALFPETSMESAQDGARPNFQHATPKRKKSKAKGAGWGNQAPDKSFAAFAGITSGQVGTDAQYVGIQLSPSQFPSSEPAPAGSVELLFARPFDESLVQIVQYEANVRNPRFGLPVMYRITLNDPREQHSGIGLPMATVRVHWSRVIHVPAPNRGSSQIFGTPDMRPYLNRILDLRKIYGADAEGFWQYGFPKLALSTHPQLGGDVKVDVPSVQNMLENVRNGTQREMLLMGMGASTVSGQVSDPTPHVGIQIEAICIAKGCPVRVFKGSERGELASTQDDSQWNDVLRGVQSDRNTPVIIVPFVDRCIAAGVLPVPGGSSSSEEDREDDEDETGADDAPDDEDDGTHVEDAEELSNPQRRAGGPAGVRNAFPSAGGAPAGAAPPKPPGMGTPPKPPGGPPQAGAAPPKPPKIDVPDDKPVGYSIEWPDLDSLGDKDKAQVALQITQALAAYVAGGVEAVMPVFEFLVHICGFKEEMVKPMLEKIKKSEDENMTIPPAGEEGHPATPPAPPPMQFVDGSTGKPLRPGPDGKPIPAKPTDQTQKPGDGARAKLNDKKPPGAIK